MSIHKFKMGGLNMVLDPPTNAVHVVSDVAYDLLDCVDLSPANLIEKFSQHKPEEIEQAYDEIQELIREKLLFSQDLCALLPAENGTEVVKSICLNIAHDCNLRCKYCLAGTGDFGTGRELMPFEVGKAAIDFLIEKSADRPIVEVDFFGGEPLMNFDVIKQIVSYARSLEPKINKEFRFTITTNGTLLNDEITDYINKNMHNAVLSIDGRCEVNDKFRRFENEKGTHDLIIAKFKKLVKNRDKDYYVRGTFTRENLDFTADVKHLYDSGFEQISIEPAVTNPDLDYALREEDLPKICAEYEKLTEFIAGTKRQGNHINFFHFKADFDNGPCVKKRIKGCGRGQEYVAVTPNGDIYPCHQFVGLDDYKMGNILNEIPIKSTPFGGCNLYSANECKNCWARFFCGGGCYANNAIYMNDALVPLKISCEMQKKRTECAIYLKVLEMAEE